MDGRETDGGRRVTDDPQHPLATSASPGGRHASCVPLARAPLGQPPHWWGVDWIGSALQTGLCTADRWCSVTDGVRLRASFTKAVTVALCVTFAQRY